MEGVREVALVEEPGGQGDSGEGIVASKQSDRMLDATPANECREGTSPEAAKQSREIHGVNPDGARDLVHANRGRYPCPDEVDGLADAAGKEGIGAHPLERADIGDELRAQFLGAELGPVFLGIERSVGRQRQRRRESALLSASGNPAGRHVRSLRRERFQNEVMGPSVSDDVPMRLAAVLEHDLPGHAVVLRVVDRLPDGAFENDADRREAMRMSSEAQAPGMGHLGQPEITDCSLSEDATQSRALETETIFDGQAGKW